ncbi:glycoside hydrolase family 76 protein [Fulvivirga ligni]|uniref:glycoside hydrolase family 76 protein n=1 Tax=Fulvivirga ligni TaxID=2904246 RepID=UPI001F2A626A|nr:glycoside hydrolase family 76 protein [Fulvivirga ligni]UII18958.1 T9SS type A sorting domain-containing protein [Fulvivirga ligni]
MTIRKYIHLFWLLLLLLQSNAFAQIENPRADSAINAFNDAFLITNTQDQTAYRRIIDSAQFDSGWTLALNIQGMLDAYERSGDAGYEAILNDLMGSFLVLNSPPYEWDGWNDDLAWVGLLNARAHQMIGNQEHVDDADYFFRLAYDRGWNTDFNGGGIWEQQPNYSTDASSMSKDALSNNPNGHLAALLYQSTGDQYYLDKAIQIYDWSVTHIFNPKNGHVYAGIYRNDHLNKALTAYSQGSFIDYSTLLYDITGEERFLRNAILAADYTLSQLTNEEGIISTSQRHHNTWAGEFARGLGHLAKSNPELWNKYYPVLKNNSDVTWANRRRDLNLTWNGWAIPTEEEVGVMSNVYISAVALHQHTPIVQPILSEIEAENYNFWAGAPSQNITANAGSIQLQNDEWAEYVMEIPEDGTYTISLDVAATSAASLELLQDKITLTTVSVPATNNFQTYATVSAPIMLKQGFHAIRLKAVNGEINIDKWSTQKCDLIVPSVSVNDAPATDDTEITLDEGDNLLFSPQPSEGTWSWTGPNNFSANTRVVSITDISPSQGGIYTAHYTGPEGCISVQDFRVTLSSCDPTALTTTVTVFNDGWQETSGDIEAGSYVKITSSPEAGSWSWTGPNGFTANTREITFNSIGYENAGEYTLTYHNANGCESTTQVTLALMGEDPCSSAIIPYININGWKEGTYGSVNEGASFQFGPQPTYGSWSWSGPAGFTSNQREVSVNDFDQTKAGTYTATYTNEQGCVSTQEFIIGLAGCTSASIVPDITVNGTPWAYSDSISLTSGGSYTITPPDIGGHWSWTGDNNGGERWEGLFGFSSNERIVSFSNVLDIRGGKLTLMHADENACISTYAIDIYVEGDDYCATQITPYINVNNEGWEQSSSGALELGQGFTTGPQLADSKRAHWIWTGPDGFNAEKREISINNIQENQLGTYKVVAVNNIGCKSSIDYIIAIGTEDVVATEVAHKDAEIIFYPNPATETVKIMGIAEDAEVQVFDLNGRSQTANVSYQDSGEAWLDMTRLKPGIYFIKVNNENKAFKLIKQ